MPLLILHTDSERKHFFKPYQTVYLSAHIWVFLCFRKLLWTLNNCLRLKVCRVLCFISFKVMIVCCIAALLRRTLFFLSLAFSCQTKDVYSKLLDIYRLFRFYKCAAFYVQFSYLLNARFYFFYEIPKNKMQPAFGWSKVRVVRCSFAFACTQIKHKPFPRSCLYDSYQKNRSSDYCKKSKMHFTMQL